VLPRWASRNTVASLCTVIDEFLCGVILNYADNSAVSADDARVYIGNEEVVEGSLLEGSAPRADSCEV
jgi:hypothetical protein